MPIFDNVEGVWREVKNIYDNVSGVWKTTKVVSDNVDGVWRESYRKNSLDDYLTPYHISTDQLQGTYKNENHGSYLLTEITGQTAGNTAHPVQVGWTLKNIPPGAKVTMEWEFMKNQWAMNDAIVTSNGQQLAAETSNFTRKRSEYFANGSMNVFINFWTTGQTTSYFKIYHISIGNQVVYPVQQ